MDNKTRIDQLVMRMQAEAKDILANNRQRGVALITAHVLMDANGSPILWVVPTGKRIEPTRDAASIIEGFLSGGGNGEVD